jgi:hypothetical protein
MRGVGASVARGIAVLVNARVGSGGTVGQGESRATQSNTDGAPGLSHARAQVRKPARLSKPCSVNVNSWLIVARARSSGGAAASSVCNCCASDCCACVNTRIIPGSSISAASCHARSICVCRRAKISSVGASPRALNADISRARRLASSKNKFARASASLFNASCTSSLQSFTV